MAEEVLATMKLAVASHRPAHVQTLEKAFSSVAWHSLLGKQCGRATMAPSTAVAVAVEQSHENDVHPAKKWVVAVWLVAQLDDVDRAVDILLRVHLMGICRSCKADGNGLHGVQSAALMLDAS